MTLVFDAVGPSSAGAGVAAAASLSWSHTVGTGASRLILVGVGVSNWTDTISSVTCGGTAMSPLGAAIPADGLTANGYVRGYILIAPATGANSIVVTMSGTTPTIEGGSISYSGADQVTGVGTITTHTSDGTDTGTTSATATTTTSTPGNILVAFSVAGTAFSAAVAPAVSQFIKNEGASSAAGNLSGSAAMGTGSAVTMTETISGTDIWSVIIAEVLADPNLPTGIIMVNTPLLTRVTATPVTGSYNGYTPAAGDLLVAVVSSAAATSCTAPALNAGTTGWTLQFTEPNTASSPHANLTLWTKVAGAGEAAPAFASTLTGTGAIGCIVFALRKAVPSGFIQLSAVSQSGASALTITTQTVSTGNNVSSLGEFVIAGFVRERAAGTLTWAPGSGYINAGNDGATSSVMHLAVDYQFNPPTGAIATETGTWSGTATTAFASAILVVINSLPYTVTALNRQQSVQTASLF